MIIDFQFLWMIYSILSNIRICPIKQIDGLVQERRNSTANALELRFRALTHRDDKSAPVSITITHRDNSASVSIH